MSLLQIVNDVALEVGLDTYTAAISGDLTVRQIVALCQRSGDNLARRYDWKALKVAATYTGDGTTTLWALPADWDRSMPGEAQWSLKYPAVPLGGVVSDEEWLALTSLPVQPQRPLFRYINDNIETYPALASGEIVNCQYRSSYWISTADGTVTQARWGADTDFSLIPERLITMDVVWRWKRAKGLDYAEEFTEFQVECERTAGQDSGPRTIRTSRGLGNLLGSNPFNPIVNV